MLSEINILTYLYHLSGGEPSPSDFLLADIKDLSRTMKILAASTVMYNLRKRQFASTISESFYNLRATR